MVVAAPTVAAVPHLRILHANSQWSESASGMCYSFIHFIFLVSIYRLNTKDVEIVIVVTISGKVTNVRCFNTIIIQWSHSN